MALPQCVQHIWLPRVRFYYGLMKLHLTGVQPPDR